MEVLRELMKRPRQTDNLAIGMFVLAVLYTILNGSAHTILVGIGFTMIVLGALPRQVALAFLVGASAILLVQTRGGYEGFTSEMGGKSEDAKDKDAEKEKEKETATDKETNAAADAILHGTNAVKNAEAEVKKADVQTEKFTSSGKPMLPDNADRKEMLELGKPYKLPNENDDKGFHLDSGTTFLNAYKALKPDQIAAMTKDTQELLATQKSLIGMLDSFGPLMKDMSKITGIFGPSK